MRSAFGAIVCAAYVAEPVFRASIEEMYRHARHALSHTHTHLHKWENYKRTRTVAGRADDARIHALACVFVCARERAIWLRFRLSSRACKVRTLSRGTGFGPMRRSLRAIPQPFYCCVAREHTRERTCAHQDRHKMPCKKNARRSYTDRSVHWCPSVGTAHCYYCHPSQYKSSSPPEIIPVTTQTFISSHIQHLFAYKITTTTATTTAST